MGRVSKEEALKDKHSQAITRFDRIQSAMRDVRLQCLQDRRFYSIAGAQWEGDLADQFENKPKFEVNKIHLAVIRIINEYRNNKISALFTPKDGEANDKLADTCNGLHRADEQDSTAEEAYDNAFEEGVGGGMGAWRLRAEYEDEEDEDCEHQRIRIEPIFDADSSVFFDLDAKRQDKSDANHCYVITSMSRDAFESEYDISPDSISKQVHQSEFDWFSPDVAYVAEYYEKEKQKETFHIFRGLDGQEEKYSENDLDEETANRLEITGFREVRQKVVKRTRIHKYILCGSCILEDCGFIAGRNIPIVVFYGKRWFIDNVERCMGHVRLAKDLTRLKNMQLSKLGEISAYSTVEKPIFTPEQVAGVAHLWAEDNVKNYPYMLLNPIYDQNGQMLPTGPIGYTKPPSIPPAMAALLQLVEQDIQDVLGNQEAGEQLQSNMSGIAVELIQNKLDMQTFIYISNMAKAIKRSAEIWLSMAKEIMVEQGRKMKTVGNSGEVGSVELMKRSVDPDTNADCCENDLSEADFDVMVEVGPTSASKRSAISRAATNMLSLTQDPETQTVLTALALMNMEGEGLSDIREYFRKKLVRLGVMQPTEEDKQEMEAAAQNAQPDPQAQYLQAAAKQAEAAAAKAGAETVLTAAKAEQTKAQTAATLADMDQQQRTHVLDVVERLNAPAPANQGL